VDGLRENRGLGFEKIKQFANLAFGIWFARFPVSSNQGWWCGGGRTEVLGEGWLSIVVVDESGGAKIAVSERG